MKTFALLFTLCCIQTFSFSQKNTLELKSTTYNRESSGNPYILSVFKNSKKEHIILKTESIKGPGGWNYYLEVRDKELNKTHVEDVSEKLDGDNYLIESILKFDDEIVVFGSKLETSSNKEIYYYQTLNVNTYEVSKRTILHEVTYEKKRKRASLAFGQSQNAEYLLVKVIPSFHKNNTEFPKLKMFNKNLELLWEKEYKTDQTDESERRIFGTRFSYEFKNYEPFKVSNDGVVFTVTDNKLVKITENNEESEQINLQDFEVYGLKLGIDPSGEPIICGYYSEEKTKGIKGVFYQKFNASTMNVIKEEKTVFSKEMIQLGMSMKSKEKADKKEDRKDFEYGASNLSIDDVVFDENGSMFLVGSIYYVVVTVSYNSNGTTTTRYTYYYRDIFVSKFNELGEHIYDVKIPKYNVYSTPTDTYTYNVKDGKIAFYFLDNVENLNAKFNLEAVKRVTSYKGAYLAGVSVSEDGSVSRENFFDYTAKGLKKFRVFTYLNAKETAVIFSYTGKKSWEFLLGTIK